MFISCMLTSNVYSLIGIVTRVFLNKLLHAPTHVLISTALPVALWRYRDAILTCRPSDCAYCFRPHPPYFLSSLLVFNLNTICAMKVNNEKKWYLIYRVIKRFFKNNLNFLADEGSQQMKTAFNNLLY